MSTRKYFSKQDDSFNLGSTNSWKLKGMQIEGDVGGKTDLILGAFRKTQSPIYLSSHLIQFIG